MTYADLMELNAKVHRGEVPHPCKCTHPKDCKCGHKCSPECNYDWCCHPDM